MYSTLFITENLLNIIFSHARQLMEDTIRRNASPVRPEQPEGVLDNHEVLGGSSSSLNSSASDDSIRISQGGIKFVILRTPEAWNPIS